MPIASRRSGTRAGKRGKQPSRHRITADQFRDARKGAGLTREQASGLLGVSLRTVGGWETGASRCPYAAFKLLRVLKHGEFMDVRWSGFQIIRGKLVTPENHEIDPGDLAWLTLLCRRADAFSELLHQRDARAGRTSVASTGLVYSVTSRTPVAEFPVTSSFQWAMHGAVMGPEWGHEASQARTQQAQSADASGSAGRSRSPSGHHGGEPECLLPAGAAEFHSVHPEADSPFDCGHPCEEADTDAAGQVIDCPFSSCEHLGENRAERSMSVRLGAEVEAVPRQRLKAPLPQQAVVLGGVA